MKAYKQKALARRYAAALYDVALENDLALAVYNDMLLVYNTLHQNPELRLIMARPVVPPVKKRSIFQAIFTGKIAPLCMNFLMLIIVKGRQDILLSISAAYIALYRYHNNIHDVTVRAAAPLSDDNRKSVTDTMMALLQGDIELTEEIRPDLIGGFQLFFEDNLYDASVAKHIRTLKREFSDNLFIKQY
jgi:F-type H+-transporting ATPase subunit delta